VASLLSVPNMGKTQKTQVSDQPGAMRNVCTNARNTPRRMRYKKGTASLLPPLCTQLTLGIKGREPVKKPKEPARLLLERLALKWRNTTDPTWRQGKRRATQI